MITRTRGGAVANGVSYDLPLRYKTAKHSAEKQRIGAAAAALVAPGMVVGLNGGTTTTEVARALAVRPDLNTSADGAQLTVVTNALNIANELLVRSRMKIVVTGGVVRPQSLRAGRPARRRHPARGHARRGAARRGRDRRARSARPPTTRARRR